MLTIQKVLFLRRVNLFSSMSSRELGAVALIAEEVVYPAGTAVIRLGEFGDAMFLIVDGEVRIHKGNLHLNTLHQNGYFGEMTILDGGPRSASATAVNDCLVLRIKQSDFHTILASNFPAVLAIMRTLSQRIRKAEERAAEMARAASPA